MDGVLSQCPITINYATFLGSGLFLDNCSLFVELNNLYNNGVNGISEVYEVGTSIPNSKFVSTTLDGVDLNGDTCCVRVDSVGDIAICSINHSRIIDIY